MARGHYSDENYGELNKQNINEIIEQCYKSVCLNEITQ
jgi:hypothetical protein